VKKVLFLTAALILFFAFCTTASANLIQYGNFETGTIVNGPEFQIGSPTKGDTGEWYALSPWTIQPGGPLGSSYYFDHLGGGGSDQRAFQPVDTSSMSLAGQEITLSFNYIYEPGTWAVQSMGVALVGLSGINAKYNAYGGLGYDGYDVGWYGADAATVRTVLGTLSLGQTSGSGIWGSDTLAVTLTQDYDVVIAVFASSAWSGSGGLRGIDNVSLTAPVPEPATMLLLGAGLLGLAGFRKRFKK